MLNIVVCVSGGGTNLQAIIDAVNSGRITNTKIAAVISNKPDAYALERAAKYNIPGVCVSRKAYETKEAFDKALLDAVDSFCPDLIVLAGFLVIIPERMTEKYSHRIINIHPSLIPSFCGDGFYGLHVHEKVLARGVMSWRESSRYAGSRRSSSSVAVRSRSLAGEIKEGSMLRPSSPTKTMNGRGRAN